MFLALVLPDGLVAREAATSWRVYLVWGARLRWPSLWSGSNSDLLGCLDLLHALHVPDTGNLAQIQYQPVQMPHVHRLYHEVDDRLPVWGWSGVYAANVGPV